MRFLSGTLDFYKAMSYDSYNIPIMVFCLKKCACMEVHAWHSGWNTVSKQKGKDDMREMINEAREGIELDLQNCFWHVCASGG